MVAALALAAGRTVSSDLMLEHLWGDRLPAQPRRALHTVVARLRAILGDGSIDTVGDGYALRTDAVEVDLLRFRALLRDARTNENERDLLDQALRLWRGDPLVDVDSDSLRDTAIAPLREEWLAATLRRIDLDLADGRHHEVVGELRELAAAQPLTETVWSRLVTALYGSDRRAEAFQAYHDIRTALRDELGIDPGDELVTLYRTMLRGTPQPQPELVAIPRQLPADLADFVGREQLLADLHATTQRVCVLRGPAGIGKTATAVHFGHRIAGRFPDGQLYLDLRGFSGAASMEVAEALGQLTRALGLRADRVPADEQELAATYRSLTAGKRLLVVLDNARGAEQVRPLIPAGAQSRVLVTSRTMLTALDGAADFSLRLLVETEAVELLARAAGRQTEAPEAARLVRQCAHLPLAVRIAGARLAARPGWSAGTLAELLDDERGRLDELTVGDRGVRASFAASYRALAASDDPVDRTAASLFARLGLLHWAELTVPVAAALADIEQPRARRGLERLVDDHLLTSPAPGRYRTHDLLRVYARELGAAATEPVERALTCYLAAAEQATRLLLPDARRRVPAEPTVSPGGGFALATVADAHDWIEAEQANLMAAVRQASVIAPELAVRLTVALYAPLDNHGRWVDLLAVRQLAASIADPSGRAYALRDAGFAAMRLGRFADATGLLERGLAAYDDLGDRYGRFSCMLQLGQAFLAQGRFVEATGILEKSYALCQEMGHRVGECNSLDVLGMVHRKMGRLAEAIDFHRRAVAIGQEIGNRRAEASAVANLGWACLRAHRVEEAIACHRRSLIAYQELGQRYGEAESLWGLGEAYRLLRDMEEAEMFLSAAVALLRQIDALTEEEAETLPRQAVPDMPAVIRRNL
ncbi:AfsR/SARP family transcriptional regulator [Fodinicola acaciae]|uniref:AfsR/SARP family transcriptional regulator n=1 Tax=Fodinicola acaciae TaxID=2681555 RepID=UPI0013D85B00|nr:BTAD domain-containing putative transcriptional regulator [Fodinicola acaciae]